MLFDGINMIAKIKLMILTRYEVKIAKICNLWILWPLIRLKKHIFKIIFTILARYEVGIPKNLQPMDIVVFNSCKKPYFQNPTKGISYRPERPEVADFCYFCFIPSKYH